jgi:hypothetical protein
MATPNARKLKFSSQVIATQLIELEETTTTRLEYQASPNKMLGGNGTVAINAHQGDDWTSFNSKNSTWSDQEETWTACLEAWSGEISINSSTPYSVHAGTGDNLYTYIKNTGDTTTALVSLNGTSGNYYISIPPGAALSFRADGTNLENNEIYAKTASGTTTIEYLIAKE